MSEMERKGKESASSYNSSGTMALRAVLGQWQPLQQRLGTLFGTSFDRPPAAPPFLCGALLGRAQACRHSSSFPQLFSDRLSGGFALVGVAGRGCFFCVGLSFLKQGANTVAKWRD